MRGQVTRATAGTAWVLALWVAGCGEEPTPPPEAPSSAVDTEPRAAGAPASAAEGETVEGPTPSPPPHADAFVLPGLREQAPAERLGWPTESVHITSSFGWRVDPVTGLGTRLHRGIDLRGAIGDLVMSIGAGTVSFAGHDPLLGNLVIVDHGGGLESFYGHLSDILVVSDVVLERGAAIGLVGNTGRSAAPHLHLSIRLDGVSIDPLEVIGEPQHRPAAVATSLEQLEQAAAPPAPAPPTPTGDPIVTALDPPGGPS